MDDQTTVTDDASSGSAGFSTQSDTLPAGAAVPQEAIPAAIEAILLTADKPVSILRIGEALGLVTPDPGEGADPADPAPLVQVRKRRKPIEPSPDTAAGIIERSIADLNSQYQATGRAFRIESVAGGYRLMTVSSLAPVVARFHRARAAGKLSRPAIETLAIIAYKQPITRAHLESIRGVNCGEVLRSLMDRRLVIIKGRAEELGRPMLYGTSREFLDAFGLPSLKDLPTATELQITP